MSFLAPFCLLILTFQKDDKTSYPPYAAQIAAVRKEMAAIKDWTAQKNAINNYFARYQAKNAKKPNDAEVVGTTFRLIYRIAYLGYSTHDSSYSLARSASYSRISSLKDSIEKDICMAFYGINSPSGWIFDQFPEWKKNSVLTMLCFSSSTLSVTTPKRYAVFKSAYEPTVKELSAAPPFRKVGVDAAKAMGDYLGTRDKKYIRQYVDLMRKYATMTPDKESAERARKKADQFEEWHFGKKKAGG